MVDFDPQKFFIGLMDFFSILLPGALLTWLFMDAVGPLVIGENYSSLSETQAWAAFLFASYLLGHLIFLLGTWLDEFYDWVRRYTLDTQIKLLTQRGLLLPRPVRALIWLVFKDERNLSVNRAVKIKQQILQPLQAKDSINAFQWCKALLNSENPSALAAVQRFEADSKFFRCFAIVLLILLLSWPWQERWPTSGILVVLALLVLALWRYMEQRLKATNQAYWFVITSTAKDGKLVIANARPPDGAPTHAGGVVFRRRDAGIEYLLVEATKNPTELVLPKGHIEEGEEPHETAVREVHEETGVWASIGVRSPPGRAEGKWRRDLSERHGAAALGEKSYPTDNEVVVARFYLMELAGYGLRQDKRRKHVWLPLEQAIEQASHIETQHLLAFGEQKRRAQQPPQERPGK